MRKIKIYIRGMHCSSCEKLLETEFSRIKNIRKVSIAYRKGEAEIEYQNQKPDFRVLQKIAEKFSYQVFENLPKKNEINLKTKTTWNQWVFSGIILVGILGSFQIFQNLGIVDKIDIGNGRVNYGFSFLMGLVASVSSCLVVVGSVIIAFGEKHQSKGTSFFATAVKPNLVFHLGRLATFFVLGGLLGLIGGEISVSGNSMAILTIFVSIVMILLGLNVLGFLPAVGTFGIKMPKYLTKHWKSLGDSEHKLAPFLLGGLSFFLPCGFTQSMQLYALSSGDFLSGGLNLFFFALGTIPALFLLGVTASWISNKKMIIFQKVAGFLIVIFTVYTFNSGRSLLGVDTAVLKTENQTKIATNKKSNESKKTKDSFRKGIVVRMKVTSQGFKPNVLKIKQGVPVRWIITGEQVSGCTNKIIIPKLNQSINIQKGENILEFTPTEKGTLPFSCWMGMVRGKFIVE